MYMNPDSVWVLRLDSHQHRPITASGGINWR